MDKEILVVVDMQPGFVASRVPELVSNIRNLIKKAKKKEYPIVIVELRRKEGFNPKDYGKTISPIMDLVQDYEHVAFVDKAYDNGGAEVWRVVCEKEWRHLPFLVCGCNLCCCVFATASDLSRRAKVKISQQACGCYYTGTGGEIKTHQCKEYADYHLPTASFPNLKLAA